MKRRAGEAKRTGKKTLIREYHEWVVMRWLNERDASLPRVLLIGDSIVEGHAVLVHKRLKGRFCVDCFATSKHITDVEFLSDLEFMLQRKPYALIVFNNGLHGFDIDDALYGPALRAALTGLQARTPRLAWRSSTPLFDWPIRNQKPRFEKRMPRVLCRNAEAQAISRELGLPVLDLYAPMSTRPDLICDGVHCTAEGSDFQAQLLAAFIEKQFEE